MCTYPCLLHHEVDVLQSILRECVQPISKRARPEALTNAREVVRLCVSRDAGRQRLLERLDASVLAGVGRDMGPQKAALVLAQAKGQGLDMGACCLHQGGKSGSHATKLPQVSGESC